MKNFSELRKAAGLKDRREFVIATGISMRSLSAFDNDEREPPIILVKFLRLLANGCRYCQLSTKSDKLAKEE